MERWCSRKASARSEAPARRHRGRTQAADRTGRSGDRRELAARYRSAELGDIVVSRIGAATWFDFGGWKSEVASRIDEDGTTSFVTIAPAASGYELVIADRQNGRSLVLRDGQHEYVFAEAK